jgi:hypothetical protein
MISLRLTTFVVALLFSTWPLAVSGEAYAENSPAAESTATGGSGTLAQLTQAEQNALSALQEAGYTQVRDVKSTAEGISAKAVKDGKEVSLVIDSGGKIQILREK